MEDNNLFINGTVFLRNYPTLWGDDFECIESEIIEPIQDIVVSFRDIKVVKVYSVIHASRRIGKLEYYYIFDEESFLEDLEDNHIVYLQFLYKYNYNNVFNKREERTFFKVGYSSSKNWLYRSISRGVPTMKIIEVSIEGLAKTLEDFLIKEKSIFDRVELTGKVYKEDGYFKYLRTIAKYLKSDLKGSSNANIYKFYEDLSSEFYNANMQIKRYLLENYERLPISIYFSKNFINNIYLDEVSETPKFPIIHINNEKLFINFLDALSTQENKNKIVFKKISDQTIRKMPLYVIATIGGLIIAKTSSKEGIFYVISTDDIYGAQVKISFKI